MRHTLVLSAILIVCGLTSASGEELRRQKRFDSEAFMKKLKESLENVQGSGNGYGNNNEPNGNNRGNGEGWPTTNGANNHGGHNGLNNTGVGNGNNNTGGFNGNHNAGSFNGNGNNGGFNGNGNGGNNNGNGNNGSGNGNGNGNGNIIGSKDIINELLGYPTTPGTEDPVTYETTTAGEAYTQPGTTDPTITHTGTVTVTPVVVIEETTPESIPENNGSHMNGQNNTGSNNGVGNIGMNNGNNNGGSSNGNYNKGWGNGNNNGNGNSGGNNGNNNGNGNSGGNNGNNNGNGNVPFLPEDYMKPIIRTTIPDEYTTTTVEYTESIDVSSAESVLPPQDYPSFESEEKKTTATDSKVPSHPQVPGFEEELLNLLKNDTEIEKLLDEFGNAYPAISDYFNSSNYVKVSVLTLNAMLILALTYTTFFAL